MKRNRWACHGRQLECVGRNPIAPNDCAHRTAGAIGIAPYSRAIATTPIAPLLLNRLWFVSI